MTSSPPALLVSLVSGPDACAATVARAVSGDAGHRMGSALEFGDTTARTGEFAIGLADHLCDLADCGQHGSLVIQLDPLASTIDTGLILESVFGSRDAHEAPLTLHDLITVARVPDIRRLLFRDARQPLRADSALDLDAGERLALQLEFATVIALADLEHCTDADVREVCALLTKLNPRATILSATASAALSVLTSRAGNRGAARLGERMGWLLELGGQAGVPRSLDGISTVVFRDPRPFHPWRLAEVVDGCLEPDQCGLILRSRGLMRLASRPDRVGSWSIAGPVLAVEPTAMTSWDPESPLGQELVFFGRDLDADYLTRVLAACLLDDDELQAGPMEWATYRDPFPSWEVGHEPE